MRACSLAGVMVLLLAVILHGVAFGQDMPEFQQGWSRAGPAYQAVTNDHPRRCQQACQKDQHCRAWVYWTNAPKDNCWLMSQDPPSPPVEDATAYTGIKHY